MFSIEFRVPSDFLGNVGEPLDHNQSEQLHEDEPGEREVAAEESEASTRADLESAGPVAGPSGAHWEDGNQVPVGTAGAVAGPSVTRWDDDERVSLDVTVPNARMSGTRGDEVGNASHASNYMHGADSRVNDLN